MTVILIYVVEYSVLKMKGKKCVRLEGGNSH